MTDKRPPGDRRISDSMLNVAADCPFRWDVTYKIGLRPERRSTVYRVGILGHEFLRAVFTGALTRDDLRDVRPGTPAGQIVDRAHDRNGWLLLDDETYPAAINAAYGALAILERYGDIELAADDAGQPMIEVDLIAPVERVATVLAGYGYDLSADEIFVLEGFAPQVIAKIDAVGIRRGSDGSVRYEFADWKFKDRDADFQVPPIIDPQTALYAVVMESLGMPVEWATRVYVNATAPSRPLVASELPRRADGLPMLRHAKTTAAAFREALGCDVDALPVGTLKSPIREAYRKHLGELEEADAVPVRDPVRGVGGYVSMRQASAVTYDRLRMLSDHIARGVDHRNLRVYDGSRCSSAWRPCDAQRVCHATLMGQAFGDAVQDALALDHVVVYKDSPALRVEEG